jgi:hypothetical protein
MKLLLPIGGKYHCAEIIGGPKRARQVLAQRSTTFAESFNALTFIHLLDSLDVRANIDVSLKRSCPPKKLVEQVR